MMWFNIFAQIMSYFYLILGGVFALCVLAYGVLGIVREVYNRWANTKAGVEYFGAYMRYQKEFDEWRKDCEKH